MVAGSGVAGKTERVTNAVSGENDGDLLLLLAASVARGACVSGRARLRRQNRGDRDERDRDEHRKRTD